MRSLPYKLSILGACSKLGQRKDGTEKAYRWLLSQGLFKDFKTTIPPHLAGEIYESENGPCDNDFDRGALHLLNIFEYNKHLADKVSNELLKKHFLLNIGGDHSLAIGSIGGALRVHPNLKIIWVDAHADINTPLTSPSANVHGMGLSFLLKHSLNEKHGKVLDWLPTLLPQNIVQIGLRHIDSGEYKILKDLGIKYYTARDVKKDGIDKVLKESINYLQTDYRDAFHLSFDVDAIDPKFFPSTGTPVDEGLSLDDGHFIVEQLFNKHNLVSMDLVEINPDIGTMSDAKRTLESTKKLLAPLDSKGESILNSSQIKLSEEILSY